MPEYFFFCFLCILPADLAFPTIKIKHKLYQQILFSVYIFIPKQFE